MKPCSQSTLFQTRGPGFKSCQGKNQISGTQYMQIPCRFLKGQENWPKGCHDSSLFLRYLVLITSSPHVVCKIASWMCWPHHVVSVQSKIVSIGNRQLRSEWFMMWNDITHITHSFLTAKHLFPGFFTFFYAIFKFKFFKDLNMIAICHLHQPFEE